MLSVCYTRLFLVGVTLFLCQLYVMQSVPRNHILCCRYQEIAEHALNAIQKRAVSEGGQKQKLCHAPQPLNVFIAQEVYRVLLFTVFLAQVVVARHVPYIGEHFCSSITEHDVFYAIVHGKQVLSSGTLLPQIVPTVTALHAGWSCSICICACM